MDVLALIVALVALAFAGVAIALRRADLAPRQGPAPARGPTTPGTIADLALRIEALESAGPAGRAETSSNGFENARSAISRIGLVRFDAFEDAGGAQSFAVALLDDAGDGIILTSLHSRPTTRVYIKAIRSGTADAQLSEEEEMALKQAGVEHA